MQLYYTFILQLYYIFIRCSIQKLVNSAEKNELSEKCVDSAVEQSEKSEREVTDILDLSMSMTADENYENHYDTLQSIGKGAFGFVKLARKKSNKKEVKCICAYSQTYIERF